MVLALAGSARAAEAPVPPSPAGSEALDDNVDGLLTDLRRIVDAEEAVGWFVDDAAFGEIRAAVMESVCRAPPDARAVALRRLTDAAQRYGDPKRLYEREGRRLTPCVEDALDAHRLAEALRRAVARTDEDCPFWVEPDPHFAGRQTIRDRALLTLETGGVGQLRYTDGDFAIGAGGALRLLGGYGFGRRLTVLAGVEFGGGAMLKPNSEPTAFVVNYFPALPLLIRLHRLALHYDIEVAPVAVFQADDGDLSYGVRGAFSIGISALRTRGIIPWAGAGVATEYYFESGGRPEALLIRGGLRIGVLWDP
jgi:hypothetical protein